MKAMTFLFSLVMLIPMMLRAQDDYWYKKGLEAKDPKEKVEYFTKSIEKAGTSYAISNFKKCVEIDNKNFDAILGLSIAFYYKNDKLRSKQYLNQARSLEPRLNKGMDGIAELEKDGYSYSDKNKATLKKMFEELK